MHHAPQDPHAPSEPSAAVRAALARTRLVALDVDGTLTRGDVTLDASGEIQVFNVHDGQGLVFLREAGIFVVWITGRGSHAVTRRAEALKIQRLCDHVSDKKAVLERIQIDLGVKPEETVSMGDDLPDLRLAAASGTFVAPGNARPEVGERADWTTQARGGEGAVRELCDAILRAQNRFDALIEAASG